MARRAKEFAEENAKEIIIYSIILFGKGFKKFLYEKVSRSFCG
jgi:hypothetical protein